MALKSVFRIVAAMIFICLTIALFAAGYAGEGDPSLFPQARVENPVFTFSPVITGAEVVHSFSIANTGTTILNIPGVYAG